MKYDVPYMTRTRDYYRAQGYQSDYQWAKNDTTPFQTLNKPLSESRVGLITTAMPDTLSGRKTRAVYSSPTVPTPLSLYTEELSWHHGVTHTDDVASILPIEQLNSCLAEGKIGSLADEFHSLPTEYSQRATKEQDGPEILRRCQQQKIDVAILVPLWPVCHQTVSLVARHLEANGIATVIFGSAMDIVERCGAPRYLHSDLPLGNPCGVPYDKAMQKEIMAQGLELLTTSVEPNSILRSAAEWPGSPDWRDDYSKVDESNREALRIKGETRRQHQAADRAAGAKRASMIS